MSECADCERVLDKEELGRSGRCRLCRQIHARKVEPKKLPPPQGPFGVRNVKCSRCRIHYTYSTSAFCRICARERALARLRRTASTRRA